MDQPGPGSEGTAAGVGGGDGGVEDAGEDAGVGTDVLKDGDGVEGRLGVGLGGLEGGGIDTEGIGCAGAALDPYTRRRRKPSVVDPFHRLPLSYSSSCEILRFPLARGVYNSPRNVRFPFPLLRAIDDYPIATFCLSHV